MDGEATTVTGRDGYLVEAIDPDQVFESVASSAIWPSCNLIWLWHFAVRQFVEKELEVRIALVAVAARTPRRHEQSGVARII